MIVPPDTSPASQQGWFRAMRTADAFELFRTAPNAFRLAYVIAYRGQYSITFNRHGLQLGEALLGDHRNYGMSERQYRTAKQQLANWNFATFKATSKGTVGKLIDTRLFSIFRIESDGPNVEPATDGRRTGDGRATTTKNERTIRAERAKDLIEQPVRHESGHAGDGLESLVRKVAAQPKPDWHSKTLREKLLSILGSKEATDPRWERRSTNAPEELGEILDKMNCDIREGNVIRNRGAYAEELWKISRRLT